MIEDTEKMLHDHMQEWSSKCVIWEARNARALGLFAASNDQLRLQFGELTAQEIRTLRAAINYILGS